MKLITKELRELLLKQGDATRANPTRDMSNDRVVKLFTPWSSCTWFVTEAECVDGDSARADLLLFGFADLGDPACAEYGYTLLSDLLALRGPFGLKVERDMHFNKTREGLRDMYADRVLG